MKTERSSTLSRIWSAIVLRPSWGKISLALVLVLFAIVLAWSGWVHALPGLEVSMSSSGGSLAVITPSPTIDPVLVANRDQTNGIIVGGVLLVLVIIGGTLMTIRRKPQ